MQLQSQVARRSYKLTMLQFSEFIAMLSCMLAGVLILLCFLTHVVIFLLTDEFEYNLVEIKN